MHVWEEGTNVPISHTSKEAPIGVFLRIYLEDFVKCNDDRLPDSTWLMDVLTKPKIEDDGVVKIVKQLVQGHMNVINSNTGWQAKLCIKC